MQALLQQRKQRLFQRLDFASSCSSPRHTDHITGPLCPSATSEKLGAKMPARIPSPCLGYRVVATVFLFGALIAVGICIGNGRLSLARNVVSVLPRVSTKLSIM